MTMLMFGDMNLGRQLGQNLLKGEVDYPFVRMKPIIQGADAVFANLESPISDQHGETESPISNFIFCAPPVAATALKRGGITIVSTANNHAFDYSLQGVRETIENLERTGIRHVGTSEDSIKGCLPAVLSAHGIVVGFLAYTQFVNGTNLWKGRIALFDSVQVKKDINQLRKRADFVIVSFHGGPEYSEEPDKRTRHQLESIVRAGADVVVGHHPHVPQGIECVDNKLIFCSLGNFVFNQAAPWAKRSFGVELKVSKRHSTVGIESVRLIPIRAYKQPSPGLPLQELDSLVARLRSHSNTGIVTRNDSLFVVRVP